MTVGLGIDASLGSFQTDPLNPPSIQLSIGDIFATSGPLSTPVTTASGFDQLAPFLAITPNQITSFLNQLATAFGQLGNSPAMAVPLPFVDGITVGDGLDMAGAIRSKLYDQLTQTVTDPVTGNVTRQPTFTTAQQLGSQLAQILGQPESHINPQFDTATDELTFTVPLLLYNTYQSAPFSFVRNDLGAVLQSTNSGVQVHGDDTLEFTFGAALCPCRHLA